MIYHCRLAKRKMERTLFIIKPTAVNKLAEVIKILRNADLIIVDSQQGCYDINHWKRHYIEHEGKDFYLELCQEMSGRQVIVMILKSIDAIIKTRKLIGSSDPAKADVGTLRQLYGHSVRQNGFHASDSFESARREINLWFPEK